MDLTSVYEKATDRKFEKIPRGKFSGRISPIETGTYVYHRGYSTRPTPLALSLLSSGKAVANDPIEDKWLKVRLNFMMVNSWMF